MLFSLGFVQGMTNDKARCLGSEKKRLEPHKGFNASPSQTSLSLSSVLTERGQAS